MQDVQGAAPPNKHVALARGYWGDIVEVVTVETRHCLVSSLFQNVSRPEKSLHFLVNNPVTSLHIFFNPKYHLHLTNWMKRKRALLRSNSPGLIQSDEHINPLMSLHLLAGLTLICTSANA